MNDTTQTQNLPEAMLPVSQADLEKAGFPASAPMAPGLAVFFNDALYMRCRSLAQIMSRADGVMPKHLLGKPEACFAIISRSITWNLDPMAVAMSTYQTPGGSIGFEGKLIQAILENSGKLDGGVKFEEVGNWDQVKGKFEIRDGKQGGKYPYPTWTRADAKGLKCIVSAQVKGDSERRSLTFELETAFPLNSPLWATAPERQIRYTAVRAFANQAMPGILMGVPFDYDDLAALTTMTNITPPRPQKETEFTRQPENGKDDKPTETKAEETKTAPEGNASPADEAAAKAKIAALPPEPKSQPKAETAKPVEQKSEPAPSREPGDDSQSSSPEDELATWYRDQVAEIAKAMTVQALFDLRDIVIKNVDDAQAAEFKTLCGKRLGVLIRDELANCDGLNKVTALRGKYSAIFSAETRVWFDGQCNDRQRILIDATRKAKKPS